MSSEPGGVAIVGEGGIALISARARLADTDKIASARGGLLALEAIEQACDSGAAR